ncbi:MAG: CehA/McbA family metallohydrolase [Pirellulaceae bacterium]
MLVAVGPDSDPGRRLGRRPSHIGLCMVALLGVVCRTAVAHDDSLHAFQRERALAQAKADALAENSGQAEDPHSCRVTVELVDDFTQESLPGLVRVTNLQSGKAVKLAGRIHRALNWYSLPKSTTLHLPRARVRIEALRGLETVRVERDLDLRSLESITAKLTLRKFYDLHARKWYSGNTHLHLRRLSRADAERYLHVVSRSDALDVVYLSHLRRIPDETDYISNEMVEESFQGDSLRRLSHDGVLFSKGEEHRHNFGRGGEGYGHVMWLDLQKLIRPVSIGPGIMRGGTDGIALQQGIRKARADGATVIWCHNSFGYEDLPNWVGGLLHAQNIFDGGSQGSYEETFYRYLNLGMRVPFSTGTDWFIFDFARVYVPVDGNLTAARWLKELRDGKSFITNGPLLELETERAWVGDTLTMSGPNRVTIVGRGLGRLNFGGLELVYNGKVVHRVAAEAERGYFIADMRHGLEITEPGWFALRIPANVGKTELDRPLFAHTSPIYVELAGRSIFREDVARDLIGEMQESMLAIEQKATFANDGERQAVSNVYRAGIKTLQDRLGN